MARAAYHRAETLALMALTQAAALAAAAPTQAVAPTLVERITMSSHATE